MNKIHKYDIYWISLDTYFRLVLSECIVGSYTQSMTKVLRNAMPYNIYPLSNSLLLSTRCPLI